MWVVDYVASSFGEELGGPGRIKIEVASEDEAKAEVIKKLNLGAKYAIYYEIAD